MRLVRLLGEPEWRRRDGRAGESRSGLRTRRGRGPTCRI